MNISFVGKLLSFHFHKLGGSIGKHPVIYLCVCLLIALLQVLGFIRFHHLNDFDDLFMTKTGRSAGDMRFIEETFPLNRSEPIDLERITKLMRNGIIIITAKDGGSVFRKELSEEILSMYDFIYNIKVQSEGKTWNFSSICSPWWFGNCIENTASEIFRRLDDFNAGKFRPAFPIDWNSYKKGVAVTAMNFGGVETDLEHRIISAKAIRFFYQLEYRDEEKSKISLLWEHKFVEEMDMKRYEHIDICAFTLTSMSKELTATTLEGLPFGILSLLAIIAFAILTSLTSDPVKSKPWLGIAGGISALLGLSSSFGFMLMVGVPYIDIVLSVPYIMLGIGIDDSFVLIAAWRRTSCKDSVPNRMAAAYSEAAMSVTITSFTNLISFLIGIATPYKQTQIYALFCATSVLYCYFYQIVFFGACMALSGYREEKRLHFLTCRKIPQKEEQNSIKISNNTENCEVTEEKEVYSTWAMMFFRDHFSKILINRYSKAAILFVFVLYLILACIGCSRIIYGPDYLNGFRYGSSGWKYLDWNYRYFGDYPHRVQVVINEELDYSNPLVQAKVENLTKQYETASFSAGPMMTEHWLRSYKHFLESSNLGNTIMLNGFNTSNPHDFHYVLRNIFFKIPVFKKFSSDVVFSANYTKIAKSRFIIQTTGAHDATAEKEIVEAVYDVTDNTEYKTVAFSYLFRLIEQSMFVKSVAIQTILCTAAAMILVFLILVPDLRCSLLVAFCLCSIEVGVIGCMTFWNVNLDPLSLVCLIMCVGFSVDFASHVSYAYATCKEITTEGRIRYSMYSAGVPVLQGAGSTILGVIFLNFTSSNSFVIIFKIIFLTMMLACLHSLFILPVLLSFITPQSKKSTTHHQSAANDEVKKLNITEKVTDDVSGEIANENKLIKSHCPN